MSEKVYEVTVTAGQVTEAEITNNKKGSFTINKAAAYVVNGSNTDDVVREPLINAKFTLYKYEDGKTVAESTAVKEIDMTRSAYGSAEGLETGIYWLVETKVPDGFEKADDSLVQVYADGSVKFAEWVEGKTVNELTWVSKTNKTITVDNFSENPRIRLIKTAYNSPATMLNGAKFEVYVEAADGTPTDVDGVTVNLKPVYNDGTFVKSDDNSKLILEKSSPNLMSALSFAPRKLRPPV